jgi:transposase
MIRPEVEAEILRVFHAEKWRVGTIAKQLDVHHSVVERVLAQAGVRPAGAVRGSVVDAYLPFIKETLEKYPTLTASRLYEMVRQRGYARGADHFRHIVAGLRPRPPAEAYLRVRTLPGEQAQVDWGHFGKVAIGRAMRPLMAFVMVLSFSRMTFLRFYLDAQMPNFLRGHVDAFAHFAGVPRVVLYDNLKSAVLERDGSAIRFNPRLLELKKHYRFDPRPVAPARGNEKGRVERKIRDIRQSFFAARTWTDIDDLNTQALQWCTTVAAERPCPEDRSRRVRDVFEDEKTRLLPLPTVPFDTTERVEVSIQKTPYARFDKNDYSIPHDRTRRMLVVFADPKTVRIAEGTEVIAQHDRSFDKGAQIEIPEHIDGLRAQKRNAKARSMLDQLHRAAPSVASLLELAAERGAILSRMTTGLRRLLDSYGAQALERAVRQALEQQTPHLGAVQQILEVQRKDRGAPPPLQNHLLPSDARIQDIDIRPHELETYDHILEDSNDDDTTH